jgi:hypothetical protein
MKNRFISFDNHIIEEVAEVSGFRPEQVRDVMVASISYIHHLMNQPGILEVTIPHIGTLICNRHALERRKKALERRFIAKNYTFVERKEYQDRIKLVKKKIDMIDGLGKTKRTDRRTYNDRQSMRRLFYPYTFSGIQDIQTEIYNAKNKQNGQIG